MWWLIILIYCLFLVVLVVVYIVVTNKFETDKNKDWAYRSCCNECSYIDTFQHINGGQHLVKNEVCKECGSDMTNKLCRWYKGKVELK